MIYLIRHAQKIDNSVHSELTKEGLNDSFLYGKKLKLSNIKIELIISSPIKRCIQTASQISKGYGGLKIEESNLLGDPGVFVNDSDKAMEIFNKYKLVDIINIQLSKHPLPGFNEIDIAVKKLFNYMKKRGSNILYISHDAIITPFVCYLMNIKKINQDNIVKYLNGYCVYTNLCYNRHCTPHFLFF